MTECIIICVKSTFILVMLNLTYLAVLEPGEAANLHVYRMERDGNEIPTPSLNLSRESTDGNVVMPVIIHPDLYQTKRDNERIKTNITLTAWLKRITEEHKVNYSRLLETALIDYLQLPKQDGCKAFRMSTV